jgi:hypothetical protein
MNVTFEGNSYTGKNEWLTPPELLSKLGHFDLDPCSPINRPWSTADRHYTILDDGLEQEWTGRVFCNPPYETNLIVRFIQCCAEHENVIALTFARTDTKVDLSTYTIAPYMSSNMKINSDELVEEAIEYFKNYNLNGVTGKLTLFGDLALNTSFQVELIDDRNPSKNGVYIVDEVLTKFGTEGYRQTTSIPYWIKGNKAEEDG